MISSRHRAHLLLIDLQEKLYPAMEQGSRVLENAARLSAVARRLGIPITLSEQYPKGLGPTVASLREAAGPAAAVIPKMAFSCWREDALHERLTTLRQEGRDQIILAGMEAHVCICQTALDLIAHDYDVFLATDAIASRLTHSRELATVRMSRAGVILSSFEMISFEWLERAGTPEFRDLIALIK